LLNLFNLFVSPVARFVAATSSVIVKLQRVMATKGPSVIVCSGDFNISRQFVHEWMGTVGFYQHFPNLPKSRAITIYSTEGRVMLFKKCGKE
jgi:hypothetical protein